MRGPNSARCRGSSIPFLFSSYKHLPPNMMSHAHSTASSSSTALPTPSSFHLIINNALEAYEKCTKKNLVSHPLAEQLQSCNSPDSIILVLQQQVQEINQSKSGDERLTKWLDPTVKVLYAFIEVLGEGVGLVCFEDVLLITICPLMFIYLSGFLTCESDLCWFGRPPFSVYTHSLYLHTGNLTVCTVSGSWGCLHESQNYH